MKYVKHHWLILTIVGLLLCPINLNAQIPPPMKDYYQKAWQTVEGLENVNKKKDALEEVGGIMDFSRKEGNTEQYIKAFLKKLTLQQTFEEETELQAFHEINAEIASAEGMEKAVLQSLLAEALNNYYQNNRYVILDRTSMAENDTATDFRTWDAVKFEKTIVGLYLASVADKDLLRSIPVESLPTLLANSDKNTWHPTLYDVLANRAIDYLSSGGAELAEIATPFVLNQKKAFSLSQEFVDWNIETKDTSSVLYKSIRLYQELTSWRIKQNNPEALTDLELKRMAFVRDKSVTTDNVRYYEYYLGKLLRTLGPPAVAEATAALAQSKFTNANGRVNDLSYALALCEATIEEYPETPGAQTCRSIVHQIKAPKLNAESEAIILPDKVAKALITYKQVPTVYAKLLVDDKEFSLGNKMQENLNKDKAPEFPSSKVCKSWSVNLPEGNDLVEHSTEIPIDPVKEGNYVLLLSKDAGFDPTKGPVNVVKIQASFLSLISQAQPEGSLKFWVTNRTTGQPISGATVSVYKKTYDYSGRIYVNKLVGKYSTNKEGIALKPSLGEKYYNSYFVEVESGKHKLQSLTNIYEGYPRQEQISTSIKTYFFTDRAIYRPGQTVYYKGIVVKTEGEKAEIQPGIETTVDFKDVNGEDIASTKLTTNEFGSFQGSFTAPIGVLNGSMSLSNESGYENIQVEEYKRPRFEVEMLPVEQSFKLNESVTVNGKATAYSGASIDGAEVKYSIRRVADFPWWWRWSFWWRPLPTGSEKIIGEGTTTTDAEGNFSISFIAEPDMTIAAEDKPFFRYEVSTDVVDITGETQSASTQIIVGYQSLNANIDVPEYLDRQATNTFDLTTQNLNGGFEPATVALTISELIQPTKFLKDRLWSRPDTMMLSRDDYKSRFPNDVYDDEMDKNKWPVKSEILSQTIHTDQEKTWILSPGVLKNSGVYRVNFIATAKNGDEVVLQKFFTAGVKEDTKLPEQKALQVTVSKTSILPGEDLIVYVGSSLPHAKVWLQVTHKGKLIYEGMPEINNAIQKTKIPITEKHIGGLELAWIMVNDNRVYQGNRFVDVPGKPTELQATWKSFRDKLLPGQQETWELNIKGAEGEKVAAEMVATLYDASLDAFLPHSFSFGPFGQRQYIGYLNAPSDNISFGISNGRAFQKYDFVASGNRIHPELQDFGFTLSDYYRYGYGRGGALAEMKVLSMSMKVAEKGLYDVVTPMQSPNKMEEPMPISQAIDPQNETPKVRTNLNETAFFLPQLRTNEAGDVILSFTMPEALTRWNMLAVAHTKDLQTVNLFKSVVTQKELMVTPNAPRFFREGDNVIFTAKVNNLSESMLNGTAQLVLKDALTGQIVTPSFGITNNQIPFSVEKGQSTRLSWNISIPKNIEAVAYEVTATAGNYTDGEGSTLPVLTNRMLVTETMPVYINGKQKRSFTFKSLKGNRSTTLQNHQLTFELSSNPAWYAIQALPYMMEYPYECAEQVFSRFYANTMAAHIANSSPKIQAVFQQWKSSGELISQLDKNQELKSLLLEETPWVRDAKNEAEARNRIAQLFDLSKLVNEGLKALDQLKKAQTPNGGFAWFKGMPDNRYITQYIVEGFGHLKQLGFIDLKEDPEAEKMLNDAISYLDKRLEEDLISTKKQDKDYLKNDHIGYIQAHYLYTRTFFGDQKMPKQSSEAYNYYLQQAAKYWPGKGLYMQGMLALALHRSGQESVAKKIIEGLRQTAVQSDEMGMYWKALQKGGWYWYEAPIETQALLIEAFNTISQNNDEVDRMRQWLIKQKQTQSWPTTKSTAEACYALLLNGTDWLSDDTPVKVWMGGQEINPEQEGATIEPGTGYYKITREGADITPQMATLQLEKSTNGPAWGAMYWQYFEQLDKITPQSTGLQLVKRVFKEVKTDEGTRLVSISEQTPLLPGDILKVRLELKSDRDLEFVHMKDMRAAGLEPINVLSQYQYKGGLGYYESTRDAATNFFFDWLPKGTYVFEYSLRVNLSGDFSNGITTIQSMYAPEFVSHTQGIRIKVEEK